MLIRIIAHGSVMDGVIVLAQNAEFPMCYGCWALFIAGHLSAPIDQEISTSANSALKKRICISCANVACGGTFCVCVNARVAFPGAYDLEERVKPRHARRCDCGQEYISVMRLCENTKGGNKNRTETMM